MSSPRMRIKAFGGVDDVDLGLLLPVEIPDPGDAGEIPARSGYCAIVSGGVETRALPDPTVVGCRLCLHFLTDGGTVTVTATSGVNTAGNNTITLDTAGEMLFLEAVKDAAGTFAWRVVANPDSIGLTTV